MQDAGCSSLGSARLEANVDAKHVEQGCGGSGSGSGRSGAAAGERTSKGLGSVAAIAQLTPRHTHPPTEPTHPPTHPPTFVEAAAAELQPRHLHVLLVHRPHHRPPLDQQAEVEARLVAPKNRVACRDVAPPAVPQHLLHLQAPHAAAAVEETPQLLLVLAGEAHGALVPQQAAQGQQVERERHTGPGDRVECDVAGGRG